VERWADEDAARQVGDRHVVARALARAALHSHGSTGAYVRPHAPALAALGGEVPDRVRALLNPPPRRHGLLAALVLIALLLTSAVAALVAQQHTDALLDNADAHSTGAAMTPAHAARHEHRGAYLTVTGLYHAVHPGRGSARGRC
jgi:hypothetical protein